MTKKELCVCIPTYNNDISIKTYLDREIDIFYKHGIDIHIYDSSENNDTKEIVEKYKREYENLFYYKLNSDIPSNVKVYCIFEEAGRSKYKYIWLIHDHTVCSEEAVVFLLKSLKRFDDFYVLNMQSDINEVIEYKDKDDFLVSSAWRLNSFGASVIKIDTFLKNVDWERISKKYNRKKTINYSHIGLYFERASEVQNFKASEIHFDRKNFIDFQRGKLINWNKDTVRICTECWGSVITSLPDVYKKKKETLRTQDRWFMSKYSLLTYKKNRTYGLMHFIKYQKWIKLIYPEDYIRDLVISLLPYKKSMRLYTRDLMDKVKEIQNKTGNIYIYGAGRHAIECGTFLNDCNVEFANYIVTELDGNPNSINEHQVIQISKELFVRPNLTIIAVLTSGVEGVKKTLAMYDMSNTEIIVFGD